MDVQAGQVQRAGEVRRRTLRPSGLLVGALAALNGLRIAAIGESGQIDLAACKGGRFPVNRIDAPAVDEEVFGIVFAVNYSLGRLKQAEQSGLRGLTELDKPREV